jgi:hypothetical protein
MSLEPPSTVGKLQKVLHAKAKESSAYRFYDSPLGEYMSICPLFVTPSPVQSETFEQ